MMSAKLLASIELNQEQIEHDLNIVGSEILDVAYSEYACGNWGTITLWNHSGDAGDQTSREYVGQARPTELGQQLDCINQLIRNNFNISLIKSVRIFRSYNGGAIYPHIDYLEFNQGFKRVHLVLKSDRSCLNSEENTVYHMLPGEVWFVDGHSAHSAMSLSRVGKYSLVLDFDSGAKFEDLYSESHTLCVDNLEPDIIHDRQPLPTSLRDSLAHIAEHADEFNIQSILFLATRFHFSYAVSIREYFQLLDECFSRNPYKSVRERYEALKDILVRSGYTSHNVNHFNSLSGVTIG
ncbi:aspartyl/asparaginyl beta-hydroxylase domain-containing protein [Xenorhabdus doucetiae]|uniref:L-proline 3-hydroxylase-like protein n=1 Tax=Xenorhabdus doucetiae TaxID=351671 RepID=A0A068QPC1_9GAMM|nr:aspartyl/asparaginyl beta-hydroxylase domain-containing protein [Xenorhabdus doucetiae]TYP08835.1 L-proline 3-hydroxylase-like protein [Xenorhabdus doucetiae]CDG16639.1 putative L-proline cis-4-hydroxylase [Xenorhabdus doucetiae]